MGKWKDDMSAALLREEGELELEAPAASAVAGANNAETVTGYGDAGTVASRISCRSRGAALAVVAADADMLGPAAPPLKVPLTWLAESAPLAFGCCEFAKARLLITSKRWRWRRAQAPGWPNDLSSEAMTGGGFCLPG